MGLLTNVFGAEPRKKPTDDVLLLVSMMLMTEVDGAVKDAERATFEAFAETLPEFRDAEGPEWDRMLADARTILGKYKGRESEAAVELEAIASPAIKRKAFVLAADLALASGDIDAREEQLLARMQSALGLDDRTARTIVNVLAMKYAR